MLPNSTVIDILSCLVLSFQPGKVSLGLISASACCTVKNLESIEECDPNHSSFHLTGFINVSWKSPLWHGRPYAELIHDSENERDLELPLNYLQDVTKNMSHAQTHLRQPHDCFIFIFFCNVDGVLVRLVTTSDYAGYEEELNLAGVRGLMARREENESAETDAV